MDEKNALIKGFNAGYWLEKHEPELSKIIQESFADRDHPYADGFIKGSNEFEQEQIFDSNAESPDQTIEIEDQSLGFDTPDKDLDFEK